MVSATDRADLAEWSKAFLKRLDRGAVSGWPTSFRAP
jgi:hypothetical protein